MTGRLRARLVTVTLTVVLVALALVSLGLGSYRLSITEVISALISDQGFATTVVVEWRLPRMLAAIVLGAALGISGALFQSLTRNPLGSPDVIGFSTGSYTGAILAITVLGGGVALTTLGAVLGGALTGVLVYALAWRGGVQGFRLIIIGVALTAMLASLNTFLLLRAQTEVAMSAAYWGAGSLSTIDLGQLGAALLPLAFLAAATVFIRRPLRQLELGDDVARAHGLRTEPARLGVVAVGLALTAVPTAVAGPIAFVSLAAPQLARRLVRGAGIPLGASALMGSFVLLGADVVAQHVAPGSPTVGMVTVVLGGIYLLALLVHEARRFRT